MEAESVKQPLSQDGYLRYTFSDLLSIEISHVMSDYHCNSFTSTYDKDINCMQSGYTEWQSKQAPYISLSWDWNKYYYDKHHYYLIDGFPFSNIKIVDNNNNDIGFCKNINFMKSLINMLDWERTVDSFIAKEL